MAAKEAQQAVQEEGRVEKRRKVKVDKKAQKKSQQQGGRRAGDNKRKAERADVQEACEDDAGAAFIYEPSKGERNVIL